jgi:LmbE family N-acetylglucosaminyl deacetylase
MPSRGASAALSALLVISVFVTDPALTAAQAAGGDYEGAIATGLSLRRLGTTARVLHIAAHPDDENTALISSVALGQGADVAYLSLTRGEGGQNSIGPELSTGLGIIRSEELMAARRLDGGTQFFARAIDYGYSKSADEAFRRWPREELLADVVEVIRRFRPDVVVSVWSGTPLDGHGQHQASGILAREAVVAAGDAARFPEQILRGLRPHSTPRYYRSAWFGERPPDVELNTGLLDPLLGRSHHQVAMASRSLHRSQDQGRLLEPGPRRTSLHRVDPTTDEPVAATRVFGRYGDGAPDLQRSLFEGIDTLLSQRAARLTGHVRDGRPAAQALRTVEALREYEELVATARRQHDPSEPWATLPALARAQQRLTAVADLLDRRHDDVDGDPDPTSDHAAHDLRFHVAAELDDLRDALLAAANVQLDVVADREWVVPGQSVRVRLGVWNGGRATIRARTTPLLPGGWAVTPVGTDHELTVHPGDRATAVFDVTVPADAGPSTAYFLDPAAPVSGTLYRWPDDPAVRALPFAPPAVRGSFTVVLPGASPLAVEREARWVGVDRRAGEFRRPVKVVPPASVAMDPDLLVLRAGIDGRDPELRVRVRAHSDDPVSGELRLVLPAGWSADPSSVQLRLDDQREHTLPFRLTPPAELTPGEYPVRAVLSTAIGDLELGFQVIDYPHISPRHLYAPARARVRVVDVDVAPVRVGYVEGAPDGVPEALDRLGVDWHPLAESDLAAGDLGRFDAIITGTRAYELRPDLVANNRRLLDWARQGGTLIVQYNQYAALDAGFAPWPVTIARPHGRVTDQDAAVRILKPDHPVFNAPNPIGPEDWEGWVQERGLYFLDSWDGPLEPLLAMSDPGEAPLTGGLLTARLGEGRWVYSGLALFRQLPEGVPGAYRLLANLISLGASR